jgi:hypothetical protein
MHVRTYLCPCCSKLTYYFRPIIGRPVVLAIALLLPILYIAAFGWTEYEHQQHQRFMEHDKVAIALLVFLGIAAFLGIFAFIGEISLFRHRGTNTTGKKEATV